MTVPLMTDRNWKRSSLAQSERFQPRKTQWCRLLTHGQAIYLFRRIVEKLQDPIVLPALCKEVHPSHGFAWPEGSDEIVLLNPRKCLLPTVVHESLHTLYPLAGESEVHAMEKQLMVHMSNAQFETLLKALAEAFYRAHERRGRSCEWLKKEALTNQPKRLLKRIRLAERDGRKIARL